MNKYLVILYMLLCYRGFGQSQTINGNLTVKGQIKVVDPTIQWDLGFGMNGDPSRFLSIDVVNSAIDSDPLELVHNIGSGVIIGNSGSTKKFLKVNGPFSALSQIRIIDPTINWDLGFGMNGDPSRFLSIDVVNSAIDSDPLELVHNRGSGVIIGNPHFVDRYLKVYGTTYTKEVNVTLSIPGPDYVFEKGYELLPLAALESYINQNKHLPEIPSSTQMQTDGINLKEMNLLLLKKVEELTLHLIEKEKKISTMEKRIDMLEHKQLK